MLVEVVFNLSLTGILWQLLPCRRCLNIFFGESIIEDGKLARLHILGWEMGFSYPQIYKADFKSHN